jgi:hypothetical protein
VPDCFFAPNGHEDIVSVKGNTMILMSPRAHRIEEPRQSPAWRIAVMIVAAHRCRQRIHELTRRAEIRVSDAEVKQGATASQMQFSEPIDFGEKIRRKLFEPFGSHVVIDPGLDRWHQ